MYVGKSGMLLFNAFTCFKTAKRT